MTMPAWVRVLKDAVDRDLTPEQFYEEHDMSVEEYIARAERLGEYVSDIHGGPYAPMPRDVLWRWLRP